MTKLKPCPFCGSGDLIMIPYYDESCVACQECKCEGPSGDYEECQKLWNNTKQSKDRKPFN